MTDAVTPTRPERIRLPDRAEIEAMFDVGELNELLDKIDRAVTKMETDLDFAAEEDDWFIRAKKALQHHRYVHKLVTKQLRALNGGRSKAATDPLPSLRQPRLKAYSDAVQRLVEDAYTTDAPDDLDRLQEAYDDIDRLIHAVEREREDEIANFPTAMRDEVWLYRVNTGLRRAGGARHALNMRIVRLRKELRQAELREQEAVRERLFVSVCRETLPQDLYENLWVEANRRYVEKTLSGAKT